MVLFTVFKQFDTRQARGTDMPYSQFMAEARDGRIDAVAVDGRTLRAFHPTPGQLVFMLAAMGHGQSAEQRFAGILNIVFASLRDEDRDYVEARLLSRDPKDRKFHETLEGVFEFLTEEWFATPTEQPSDSAE